VEGKRSRCKGAASSMGGFIAWTDLSSNQLPRFRGTGHRPSDNRSTLPPRSMHLRALDINENSACTRS
jgi:hypothetical protein